MFWVQSGHRVVNFSTSWFGVYKTPPRIWLRILSIALEEKKTQGPWLCLMTTLLLLSLLWLFFFVSVFPTSLIKLILWVKFSTDKRQTEDISGDEGKDHKVLLYFTSNEYSGLISLRVDWLDLLIVQGTLKSSPTPQFKSINSSALSLLYGPTLTSIHNYWKNHSFDYTDLCWQRDIFDDSQFYLHIHIFWRRVILDLQNICR